MAITNIKSIFATEQPLLGNEKREVKQGTIGNKFNFNFNFEIDNFLRLDFSDPDKRGAISCGVEAIFSGEETFVISGYTGYILIEHTVKDGEFDGDTYQLSSQFIQSVNIPSDIVNPPNYTLYKPVFKIVDGVPFPADFDSFENYNVIREDLNFGFGDSLVFPEFAGSNPYDLGFRRFIATDTEGFDYQGVLSQDGVKYYISSVYPTSGGNMYLRTYDLNYSDVDGSFSLEYGEAREIKAGGDVIQIINNKLIKISILK